MWYSQESYPEAMESLDPDVRNKAIEIGNTLLSEWMDEDKAIPLAIDRAKSLVASK